MTLRASNAHEAFTNTKVAFFYYDLFFYLYRYFDNKVFVALGNGELCIYKRDAGNGWDVAAPQKIQIANGLPVVCVNVVANRIWCGCQNNVVLVNATTLKIEVFRFI